MYTWGGIKQVCAIHEDSPGRVDFFRLLLLRSFAFFFSYFLCKLIFPLHNLSFHSFALFFGVNSFLQGLEWKYAVWASGMNYIFSNFSRTSYVHVRGLEFSWSENSFSVAVKKKRQRKRKHTHTNREDAHYKICSNEYFAKITSFMNSSSLVHTRVKRLWRRWLAMQVWRNDRRRRHDYVTHHVKMNGKSARENTAHCVIKVAAGENEKQTIINVGSARKIMRTVIHKFHEKKKPHTLVVKNVARWIFIKKFAASLKSRRNVILIESKFRANAFFKRVNLFLFLYYFSRKKN